LDIALFSLFEPAVVYEHLETIVLLQLFFFFSYFIKLGAAPFHQWVPDVYEGVELLVTSFLVLIISPVLVFKLFAFTKLLLPLFDSHNPIFFLFSLCGLLSIILGTFHAFSQTRIKRFLAYTGITHLGYILLSLGTSSFLGFFAGFFYLFFYIITNMVLFSLLLLMRKISGVSLIFLSHLKILLNDNVMLFVFFLIPLLSFAGFPPFAGFFSKLFMLGALVDRESILFLLLLVFYIVLSAYLYLRFIKIALFEKKSFHGFFPLKAFKAGRNQNFSVYYRIETTLNSYKKSGETLELHNNFFGILYGLNFSLFFVLSMLPLVCLLLQQPLLALFLFY
jgi:NADH-quinone oxidoreductase subunit N